VGPTIYRRNSRPRFSSYRSWLFPKARTSHRIAEVAMRSPLLAHRDNAHLVYSNMEVVGYGGVTGGMTISPPPVDGYYLDHDLRYTLSAGIEGQLPWRSTGWFTYNYGSRFLEDYPPGRLPPRSTIFRIKLYVVNCS